MKKIFYFYFLKLKMFDLPRSLRPDGFFPAATFVVKPFCQAQQHHHEYQGDTDNNYN
jgi:hypothetical protein